MFFENMCRLAVHVCVDKFLEHPAVVELSVWADQLSDAAVVQPESQNAGPVLLSLSFLCLFSLRTSGLDGYFVFDCRNKIVVAADVFPDFGACHTDVVGDM